MQKSLYVAPTVIWCAIAVCLLVFPAMASTVPIVNLTMPQDGNVSLSENVTFSCNTTSAENIYRVSLYTNINSTFSLYATDRVMELENDGNTSLLCHFDDNYTCENGETGTNSSTQIVPSMFLRGVMVNETSTLKYHIYNNIEYDQGTIEFWVKVGFDPSAAGPFYLLSVPGTDTETNEMQIYATSGYLKFNFFDGAGDNLESNGDISSWNQMEWHHVAVRWSIPGVWKMFIDGSDDNTNHGGGFYSLGTFRTNDYIYIGSYNDGTDQSDSIIDELRISGQLRSPDEINASYNKGSVDHRNAFVNWTLFNVSDGSYSWGCEAMDNASQSSWASSNHSFHVDVSSPPAVNSINFSPASTDDMDPSMVINATANVTDVGNVSSVMLQWKKIGDWSNDTMEYNSGTGLYENASFAVGVTGGVYYYRIWSNDSFGHGGYSATRNITVSYDYTWNASPTSFGTVSSQINSVRTIGNFTINNTGDDALQFSFTDNWPFTVLYNGSENPSYTVNAKAAINILVNATFESQDSERNITINITAYHPSETASPVSRSITSTLNSITGGPCLLATIATYPAAAYQGQSGISFSATVKNIGNETAQNVWLNISLPSGWNATTGNVTLYIGNISPQVTNTSSMVMALSGLATAGVATLCANATGAGVNSSDCEVVTVNCNSTDSVCGSGCTYLTDTDCTQQVVTVTGAGTVEYVGGMGGGGTVAEPILMVFMPDTLEILKGSVANLTIEVSNSVAGTNLTSVMLDLTGYPATLLRKSPLKIPSVAYGEMKSFTVEVSAPAYVEEKDYIASVSVSALGLYSGRNKTLHGTGKVVISVKGLVRNASATYIAEARRALEEMKALNLTVSIVSPLMADALKAYGEMNFDRAKLLSNRIVELKNMALSVLGQLRSTGILIKEAEANGVRAVEAEMMLTLAKAAFSRGDYARAGDRVTAALTAYQMETKDTLPAAKFFRERWQQVLLIIIGMTIASFICRRAMRKGAIKAKLWNMRKRKSALMELMERQQEMYFNTGVTSRQEYDEGKKRYEKELAELNVKQMEMSASLASGSAVGEKAALEERIKEIQRARFERGDMGSGEYNESMRKLEAELADVDRELEKRSKKGAAALLFTVLLFAAFTCPAQALENVTASDASTAIAAAERIVVEMKTLGFGSEYANHTLEEAKLLFASKNYGPAAATANYVPVIKEKAVAINGLIDAVEARMLDAAATGRSVSNANVIFMAGAGEFSKENYEKAETLLNQALDQLDAIIRETALSQATKKGPLDAAYGWLVGNAVYLVIAFLAILVASLVILNRTAGMRAERKSWRIKKGISGINSAIETLQEDYFNRGKFSKKIYEARMAEHRKDLSRASEALEMLLSTKHIKPCSNSRK